MMRFKGDPVVEGVVNKKDRPVKRGYSWYSHLNIPKQVPAGDRRAATRVLKVVGDYLAEHGCHLTHRQRKALRMILYRWRKRCRGANAYFNSFGTEPIMKVRSEQHLKDLPKCELTVSQKANEESYQRKQKIRSRRNVNRCQ